MEEWIFVLTEIKDGINHIFSELQNGHAMLTILSVVLASS